MPKWGMVDSFVDPERHNVMWQILFRRMVGKLVKTGTLTVHFPDHSVATFGTGALPRVTVRILTEPALRRLVANPDLALGEGYMDGDLVIDGDDLHGLMQVVMINLAPERRLWWHRLADFGRFALRGLAQANDHARSRRNVEEHYDLSGALYDLFLDQDRQYSCAYFRSDQDTLEQAQAQKKAHIAAKLLLRPGMRVLDIGCGWGGLAITLARDYGVHVTGITLSTEQRAVANQRVRAAGLERQIDIRLMDYRQVTGSFDRIVSVGMFEHVGLPNYRAYFGGLARLLAPEGVALIHTIGRIAPPSSTNPFIAKHIFPGGYVPAMSEVLTAIEQEALWVADVECLRLHYAHTLRAWLTRFDANRDRVLKLYDARFVRMWRYYLIASEQCFRYDRQAVFQFQLSRAVDAVPITRDYLYTDTAASALKAAE